MGVLQGKHGVGVRTGYEGAGGCVAFDAAVSEGGAHRHRRVRAGARVIGLELPVGRPQVNSRLRGLVCGVGVVGGVGRLRVA